MIQKLDSPQGCVSTTLSSCLVLFPHKIGAVLIRNCHQVILELLKHLKRRFYYLDNGLVWHRRGCILGLIMVSPEVNNS